VHTNNGNFNAALGGSAAQQLVVPAGLPDQLRELADQLRPNFADDPSSQLLLDELAEADAGTQPSRISKILHALAAASATAGPVISAATGVQSFLHSLGH